MYENPVLLVYTPPYLQLQSPISISYNKHMIEKIRKGYLKTYFKNFSGIKFVVEGRELFTYHYYTSILFLHDELIENYIRHCKIEYITIDYSKDDYLGPKKLTADEKINIAKDFIEIFIRRI